MFFPKIFLKRYFHELYVKKDIACIDRYLAPGYYDYDIGPDVEDHIQNSKEYVLKIYTEKPSFKVIVKEVKKVGSAYCAHILWVSSENGVKTIFSEGVATFIIINNKIKRRSTLYFS